MSDYPQGLLCRVERVYKKHIVQAVQWHWDNLIKLNHYKKGKTVGGYFFGIWCSRGCLHMILVNHQSTMHDPIDFISLYSPPPPPRNRLTKQ